MSMEVFLNEILAKQEDRDWVLSDPEVLAEGARIAEDIKSGKIEIEDMEAGLLPMAILAHLTQYGIGKNAARGISREVTIETMRDVNVWLDGYYQQTGVRGMGEYCWLRRHFTGDLFQIGRLQFRLEETFGLVPEGRTVIETHIPRGGKLDPQECLKSFEAAEAFFDRHFPGHGAKYFFCDSWLLSPDLGELLDDNSNILKFSGLWTHIPFKPDHSAQAIRHIFGINFVRKDLEQFPEDTSLQRKVKTRLQSGRDVNMGAGYRLLSKYK